MTKEDIDTHIAIQIKKRRKELKYNQEMIADFMGLTRTSMVNIEQGRQSLTSINIYKICCILACSPNDLYPPTSNVHIREEIIEPEKIIIIPAKTRKYFV